MRLFIQHVTRYNYTEPLRRAVQQLYLWPTNGPTQTIVDWHVQAPAPVQISRDGLGNTTGHFTFDGTTQALQLKALGTVDTLDTCEWVESASPWLHPAFYLRSGQLSAVESRITQWALDVLGVSGVSGESGVSSVSGGPFSKPIEVTRERVLILAKAVSDKVRYKQGLTDVQTQALEAFDWGAGVCQDQAHTMLAACRGLGWPARYVSGYLYAPNQPELASHAWVDVCLSVTHNTDPEPSQARWLSVDITQARLTNDQYVRLAVGTDYSSCAPSKGMRVGGGEESMSVDVAIERV